MTVLRVAAVQASYVLMDRDAAPPATASPPSRPSTGCGWWCVDTSPRPAVTELNR